jgi:hypothetical protein
VRFVLVMVTLVFGFAWPTQVSGQTERLGQQCVKLIQGRNAALTANDWNAVISLNNKILGYPCGNWVSESTTVSAYMTRGIAYYNTHNYDAALFDIRLCLSKDYANHQCRYWLSSLLFEKGDLRGAKEEKERTRRIAQGVIDFTRGSTVDDLHDIRLAQATLRNLAELPF